MKEIIIVGAGGFGRELLQWIKDINKIDNRWDIKGFIDDNIHALDEHECEYSVIGTIGDWIPNEKEVFACAIASPRLKEIVVNRLKGRGAKFEKIIHPTAIIGEHNTVGEGFVAYPHSVITVNIRLGNFVTLLNSGIGHDVTIGDYTTISSYCDITGAVQIDEKVFIGSSVTILPGRKIGANVYVGAGSVVVSNIKKETKVMGYPAMKTDL